MKMLRKLGENIKQQKRLWLLCKMFINLVALKLKQNLGRVTADEFGIKNKAGAKLFDIVGKGVTLGNLPTKFLKSFRRLF